MSPGNPYAPIAARNVFSINPPPPPGSVPPPAEPPPKITPNGIISIRGHLQALFKVNYPPKPGIPPKEQTYMLSEDQEQDEITVTKIDEPAGIVTFNNHGVVQELPLVAANASGPSGPAPGGPGPRLNIPAPRFVPGGEAGGNANNGNVIRFGQRGGGFGGQNRTVSTGGYNPNDNNPNGNASGGVNFASSRLGVALGGAGGYTSLQPGQQPQNTLSGEDQQVLIAQQHLQALTGEISLPPQIFPPTKFDTEAGIPQPAVPGGSTSQ